MERFLSTFMIPLSKRNAKILRIFYQSLLQYSGILKLNVLLRAVTTGGGGGGGGGG
jgi:hypothetical protein